MTSTSAAIDKTAKVVVTGASGYIASTLLDLLFKRGYTNVHGSVRCLSDQRKIGHLRELFPQLQLFEGDLTAEGSFDKGFEGATYVFHMASPVLMQSTDPQREIVDPAVNGTLNVLKAAEKTRTVKRVVMTSSIVAIAPSRNPQRAGYILSESDWNTDATLETPYALSKTLAEKAAWKFINENHARGGNLELVTINPAIVIGPTVSSRTDQSMLTVFLGVLNGQYAESGVPYFNSGVVDVRDVALAHILALENPKAHGRYLLSSETALDFLDQARILQREAEFKDYIFPTKRQKELPGTYRASNAKAKEELGIKFIEPRQSLIDAARRAIELGLLPPASTLRNRPLQQN
jgi:nucleoside-diphosphate-sugar epimerase